ncbi:MAG: hypothetical protein IPP96_13010 [Chitinophagaceae bacterium]|nr:hypothetical protein [Chitinophagaceae bacterium]
MKKQILTLLFAVAACFSSYAQCDKKNVLSASSTEYLNASNEVQNTDDKTTTVEFDSKGVVIMPGEDVMEGNVNSISCDWKVPYKEGKTVIKATLTRSNGQVMNIIITIEGKEGKLTLLAEFEEAPDRKVRLTLDKFEEKK